jgi:hypothetical protein
MFLKLGIRTKDMRAVRGCHHRGLSIDNFGGTIPILSDGWKYDWKSFLRKRNRDRGHVNHTPGLFLMGKHSIFVIGGKNIFQGDSVKRGYLWGYVSE